jgi:hypothetical protein
MKTTDELKSLLNRIAGDFGPLKTTDWNDLFAVNAVLERARAMYVGRMARGDADASRRYTLIEQARGLIPYEFRDMPY